MAVRKTERRVPTGLQPSDLGQAIVTPACALISFATGPLIAGREHTYVLIVTDTGVAAAASTFEWTFSENAGAPTVRTTTVSEIVQAVTAPGSLTVKVRVLDGGGSERASVTIEQATIAPSEQLEQQIARTQNTPGPGGGDPIAGRELVNEHAAYYQQVAPPTPEDGDAFRRFVFDMALNGVTRRTAAERRAHLHQLAAAVTDDPAAVPRLAATGAGVCGIRLALLAMVLPSGTGAATFLPWKELNDTGPRHAVEDQQLRDSLTTLSDDARVDLFNVVRFPKSNIMACARIVAALRDKYFNGTGFPDVLTGMSGTRAHWIIRHFHEGPLSRA
jgi:hypothetical protein